MIYGNQLDSIAYQFYIMYTLLRDRVCVQRLQTICQLAVADPGFSPGGGGAPTPKSAIIFQFFAENCMKMKEFGPPGGALVSGAPPLDPPMVR